MKSCCLYQLYDTAAESVAGPIMLSVRDASAVRNFHEVLQRRETLPGQHPDDFQLICVGEQDEETGRIVAYESPRVVATGRAWRLARAEAEGDASDQ